MIIFPDAELRRLLTRRATNDYPPQGDDSWRFEIPVEALYGGDDGFVDELLRHMSHPIVDGRCDCQMRCADLEAR